MAHHRVCIVVFFSLDVKLNTDGRSQHSRNCHVS